MDLTEFLLARIAEDEASAHASLRHPESRWDRPRLLAECEAKRLVVVWHQQYNPTGCGGDENHGREDQCPTLRALALPYADHPDYDESWRL